MNNAAEVAATELAELESELGASRIVRIVKKELARERMTMLRERKKYMLISFGIQYISAKIGPGWQNESLETQVQILSNFP